MSAAAGLVAATAATSASGLQRAQIGPEPFVVLVALCAVGWALTQFRTVLSDPTDPVEPSDELDVCSGCGCAIPADDDRCEDCSSVGHWRK